MKSRCIRIIVGIMIFVILTIIIRTTLAKYENNITGSAIAQIAKPVFIVEGTEEVKINSTIENANYPFSIKNYNNEEMNQVELEYYIEIVTKENEEIMYKLWRDEKEIEINQGLTNKISIGNEGKEEHNYKLNIKYEPKEKKTVDIIDMIEIKVHAEQKNI